MAAGPAIAGGYGTLCAQFEQFDGTNFLIVAGPTKVYKYDFINKTLIDMSGALVFSATRDDPWFDWFYKNSHYIINKKDGMFRSDGATPYAAVANAPKAKCGGVLHDHILALNYDDGVDHPQGLKWSDEGNPIQWIATPANSAGQFELDDTADVGVSMEPLGNDMILYKDRTIIPLTWVGGNEVFARRQAISGVGLNGIFALANLGDEHVIMASDNFYLYDGGVEINDEFALKIRRAVFPRLHPLLKNRARALLIEETREIIFAYPTINSLANADEWVVYNYDDKTWYGPFPIPTQTSMFGFSTRALTVVVDSIPDIVNTVNIVVDEYPNQSGGPLNLFIDGLGDIHEITDSVQTANGVPLTRTCETGDHYLGEDAAAENGHKIFIPPGTIFTVNRLLLELDGSTSIGSVQMFVGHRMNQHEKVEFEGPFNIDVTPDKFHIEIPGDTYKDTIPFIFSGRWFRLRFIVPNSQFFEMTAYTYEFTTSGRR